MKKNLFKYILIYILCFSAYLEAKVTKVSFVFDDTYKTHYTLLYPLINRIYGFKYAVAVNPLNIGLKGKMNWNDIIKLNDSGNEILNHGLSHKRLENYSKQVAHDEITISYYFLLQHGIKVDGYVIAYRNVNQKFIKQIFMRHKHIYGSVIGGGMYKNIISRYGLSMKYEKLVSLLKSSSKDYICFYAHDIDKKLLNKLIKLFNYIEQNKIRVILPRDH